MINKPTSDFIATTFDVALAQGEDGAITAKIGTGLDIPATNSFLQVDYNSTEAVGDADSPETIFYGAYNSATGALTGVVRGQAGTTDVAHSSGAEVQCGMSTAFFEGDWKEIKGTFAYASATTITVASGAASIYSVGTKLRFQNNDSGTYLYAYVVTVADALLTVVGDTVPNATLTDAYFSNAASPVGFTHWFDWAVVRTDGTAPTYTAKDVSRFRMIGRSVRMQGYWENASGGTAGSGTGGLLCTYPVAPATSYGTDRYDIGNGHFSEGATVEEVTVRHITATQFYFARAASFAGLTSSDQSETTRSISFNAEYEI